MNNGKSINWVNLHRQGVKTFKSGTVQHKFDTRAGSQQIWKEREVHKKLHFTMENKIKFISYIENCFKRNAKC